MERFYYITSRFGYLRATSKSYAPKWTRQMGHAYGVKSWDAAAATLGNINLVVEYPVKIVAVDE